MREVIERAGERKTERERERERKREGGRERVGVDARWPMLPLLCAILFLPHLRISSGLLPPWMKRNKAGSSHAVYKSTRFTLSQRKS